MNCLFCEINKGNIPSYTIYEDEKVRVFLDIHPHSNGHMLIIPKNHYLDITDIDKDILDYIYKTIAPMLYNRLRDRLKIDGLMIDQNNGTSQDVKHYHVHLIPEYTRDYPLVDIKEIFELLK